MLLFSVICAILIGWCLGGRLTRFARAGLRFPLLPVIALLFQSLPNYLPRPVVPLSVLLTASYLLIFIFLFRNRHLVPAMPFLAVGSLFNFIVISLNGFAMPVSERALSVLSSEGAAALIAGEIPMYRVADSVTRLYVLGDIIWFPVPFFQGFASVGDILLCIGVFFLFMSVMGPTRLLPRGKRESPPVDQQRTP